MPMNSAETNYLQRRKRNVPSSTSITWDYCLPQEMRLKLSSLGITWKPNALEKSFLLAAQRPVLQDRIKWNGNESLISTHTHIHLPQIQTLCTKLTLCTHEKGFTSSMNTSVKLHIKSTDPTCIFARQHQCFPLVRLLFYTHARANAHTHAEKKMTKAQSSKQVTCNTSLKLLCSNLNTSKLKLTFISGELSNTNEIPWRSFNWNRGNCSSGSRAASLPIVR